MATISCTIDTSQNPQQMTCDIPFVSHVSDGTNDFYINSMWSGDTLFIALLFLILMINIVSIFIFRLFVPQKVKIETKN